MRTTHLAFVSLLVTTALGAQTLALQGGWAIQSSAKVSGAAEQIAATGYDAAGWYPTSVPATVFSTLVANQVYPDPDYGMNLRQAAGVSYKIGANFSHEEIPEDSPYAVPWWYRTEFTLPASFRGKTVWLDFRGINYRAAIWLNGHQIASEDEAQGTFRRFEFNVTSSVRAGKNTLAVLVYAPRVRDLAITFVDWNPMPPDKDMGLWGKVFLRASGPVAVRSPWVETRLDLPSRARAHLTVRATLINGTNQEQDGVLRGSVAGRAFAQKVALAAGETREIEVSGLTLAHPRLWWPYQMGTPALVPLQVTFVQNGRISDRASKQVGLDQITATKTAGGAEQFWVNGRKVFIRGGGWTPDMMLRDGPARWALDFAYVRNLHLNAVRLEGKLMDDAFFDLADREGILVMAGWCCCDHWEEWPKWKDDEGVIADASLASQAERLRGHASVLVWLNGSDNPPPAEVEQSYLDVLAKAHWPKPILSSASAKPTSVTGESGVKMTGPYDYVPPVYWLAEPQLGGARGFNTETSPGAAIPPIESLRRFIPADHLWTGSGPGQGADDPYWSFHAGSGNFLNLHRYETALTARYGAADTLRDFDWKSQAMAYEGERAMFEAFGRRQGEATGVIQWMLNNGWPSLIWHLYDYYLTPAGGYFGAQRANEPLHVQYSDYDREVSLVDHALQAASGLTVQARVFSLEGKQLYQRRVRGQRVAGQSSQDVLTLPQFPQLVFLELRLLTANGGEASRNVYWLSDKPDVLDVKAATWFYAPESSSADFTGLSSLPRAAVLTQTTFTHAGNDGTARVRVRNPTKQVAFLVRMRVMRGNSGDAVLPVWWNDNYVTLMPGESRTLTARFRWSDLEGERPQLATDGWNVGAASREP